MSGGVKKGKEEVPLWKSVITLEPALVIHMVGIISIFMVVQDLMMDKACKVNLKYDQKICDALKAKTSGSTYEAEEKEVQKLIGSVMIWRTVIENAFPIVLVLLIGAWSDKYGRKLPVLFVVFAFLLQNLLLILCVYLEDLTGAWTVAIVSSLIASLSGNQACFMACAFSYASDNTVVEKRTMRTGITHSCIFLGLTLGLGIGGYLSHSGLPYVKCFLIGVVLELIALLYLGIMMKNQPQPGATKGKSWTTILLELFDFKHVKDAANSVFKKREGNKRTRLWFLLLAHSCCLMPMLGEMGVAYLFCRLQFSWDGGAFGQWMTFKMILGLFSNFLSMRILNHTLQLSDFSSGIVASVGNLICSLLFAFATTPTLMYLAPIATLLSGAAMVVPRATISKIIPTSELGKVNSFIGSLESIIPLIGSSIYTSVYTHFLDTLPGSFFLISASLAIPPILIYLWFLSQEKEKTDAKKDK